LEERNANAFVFIHIWYASAFDQRESNILHWAKADMGTNFDLKTPKKLSAPA
jgi:hypothetical protein